MFAADATERWQPRWPLICVFVADCLFLMLLASTVLTLRGPRLLGYGVALTSQADWWRVTRVVPGSFAWDAGLRVGMDIHDPTRPSTRGTVVLQIQPRPAGGLRDLTLPPSGETAPQFAWVELGLAAVMLTMGASTVLLARIRVPALFLLLFCLCAAMGLCGVAASSRGAAWGDALFQVSWFALLPPLTLLLSLTLPPSDRVVTVPWRGPILLAGLLGSLQLLGWVWMPLYLPTRTVVGYLFIVAMLLAIAQWIKRALPARGGPQWPEFRLVLAGLGGGFGGFALLALVPALARWPLPWPTEASGLVLLLIPASLSWALLRYRLLDLRRPLQRAAITGVLLSLILCSGLALAALGLPVLGLSLAVLLAGIGVPVAQRIIDRVLPDGREPHAALVQWSGEQLSAAIAVEDVSPILAAFCQRLGVAGLRLQRGDAVLAQVGHVASGDWSAISVGRASDEPALLEIGEKVHDDALHPSDQAALAMLGQQLGAYLARQGLLVQLQETIIRLEDTQQRLLTARRLERERLGQALHRGPLQDVLLVAQTLPPDSEAAHAVADLAASLRAILTETASTALTDLGLPAALRAYAAYLAPYARERICQLTVEVSDEAQVLAADESFVLYQLAHEALVNAVRHSGAQDVWLRLFVTEEHVCLDVDDNGHGLPSAWDHTRADHRGLRDALDLVRTVNGGSATAGARAQGGTMVRAHVPLRRKAGRDDKEETMEEAEAIRVLIAEDHTVVRQGLRRLLMEDPHLVVVGEASTGHEILSLVLKHQPDVLLLDLDLPGQNGLDALRSLKEHMERPPHALVLSAFQEEEYVRQARELGVAGFLSKGCDGVELRTAIYRVMQGKVVFDPVIASIVGEQRYSGRGRLRRYTDGSLTLSPAELVVLHEMCGEDSYEEIARRLGRGHATIRSQAAGVCQKLGVNTRQQAVLKALRLGILRLDEP